MTTNQTSLSCIRCVGKCDALKHTKLFLSVPQKQCNNAPHLMSPCAPSLCSPSFLLVLCSVVCVVPATHLMTVTMLVIRVMYITNTAQHLSVTASPRLKMDQTRAQVFFLKVRKGGGHAHDTVRSSFPKTSVACAAVRPGHIPLRTKKTLTREDWRA